MDFLVTILMCLAVLIPPLFQGGTTHLPVTLLRFLVLGVFSVHLIRSIRGKSLEWKPTKLDFPFLYFLALALAWSFFTEYKYMTIQWLGSFSTYIAVYFIAVNAVKPSHRRAILLALVLSGLVHSSWAIFQYGFLGAGRAPGGFFNPNFLAGYLVPVFSISWSKFMHSIQQSEYQWGRLKKRDILFLGIAGINLAGIFCSASRGGILMVFIAILLISFYYLRKRVLYVLIPLLLFTLLVPNPFLNRMKTLGEDPWAYGRIQIWKNSVGLFWHHPLGVGLGMYKYYSREYQFSGETTVSRHLKYALVAESDALHFLVELGLFGLVFFVWFGIVLGKELWRFWKLRPDDSARIRPEVRIGLIAGIVAIMAHSLVDSNFHNPAIAVECFWFLGMLFGESDAPVRKVTIPRGKRFFIYLIVLDLGLGVAIIRPCWAALEINAADKAMKRGELDRGIKGAERAVKICWGESSYHDFLASAYYTKYNKTRDVKWFRKTVEELQEAIQLNPRNDGFYGHLGAVTETLAVEKRNSEMLNISIHSFQKVIELRPFYPMSYHHIGYLFLTLGELGQAEAYVKKSIEIEPNYIQAHFVLGLIYEEMGRLDLAISEYQNAQGLWERFKDIRPDSDYEQTLLAIDIGKVNERLASVQGKYRK
ncbi:MAG: O-antigen ligase family protein [Proteobacteria bacterium]|nr:O-antigen ligase family protein [Pseudomonadota bacterium]